MSKFTKVTVAALVVAVLALTFGIGFRAGLSRHAVNGGAAITDEAWNILESDYVDRTRLDSTALSHAAIQGMVKQLNDPYTSFLDAQDYQLGVSSIAGEFDGIGAQVGIRDGQATIIMPLPGSAAEKAGILAEDVILEINGVSTANMTLSDVVLRVRGPSGTSVKLLVRHKGESAPVQIEVVRSRVEMASVHYEMKGDYAYININLFSERTDTELTPVLQTITEQKARGIVLDLRGNPGGLLETVVDVVSHFVTQGVVVSVRSNEQQMNSRDVRSTAVTTDLPMVVLTDNMSASGSEVLAGALQDYGRATIAGARTYGKGSVNILRQLSDGSGIYITTARWLTPKGRLIEGKGIEPDYPLDLKGDAEVQWAIDFLQGKRP